jgi:hypothetical protein
MDAGHGEHLIRISLSLWTVTTARCRLSPTVLRRPVVLGSVNEIEELSGVGRDTLTDGEARAPVDENEER